MNHEGTKTRRKTGERHYCGARPWEVAPQIFDATLPVIVLFCSFLLLTSANAQTQPGTASSKAIVLHAARLLEVDTGRIVTPGEMLVRGDKIVEAETSVTHRAGAETIDLGDKTPMPGFVDMGTRVRVRRTPQCATPLTRD